MIQKCYVEIDRHIEPKRKTKSSFFLKLALAERPQYNLKDRNTAKQWLVIPRYVSTGDIFANSFLTTYLHSSR